MLEQRLAEALCDAALRLPVQDHRIERAADIVDRGVALDDHRASLRIDLDLAHRGAIGKAKTRTRLVGCRGERALQLRRDLGILERRAGDLKDAARHVGALDAKMPIRKVEVGGIGLEQGRGDAARLGDDLGGCLMQHQAGKAQRAPRMRAAAGDDKIGIAGAQGDCRRRHAEPFGDKLRECRLVALAGALRAEDQVNAIVGPHQDLGALARGAARRLDIVRNRDAAAEPARA